MTNVHDFWSGKTSIPPGIKPVYAALPPCAPVRRNRLTGAYQMPAAVWQEPVAVAAEPVVVVEEPVQARWYSIAEKFNHIEVRMITINVPRQVVYVAGAAHYLSRAGCNALFAWLLDNACLAWGFDDVGEYVFVEGNGYRYPEVSK